MKPLLFMCILTAFAVPGVMGDTSTDFENNLMMRLVEKRAPGGAVWLGSGQNTFLSLYLETDNPELHNAAIILHSMGMHPDWPELISPLRKQLPLQGWATLSIQLPVLSPDTGIAEYGRTFFRANRRIRAAIRYLLDKDYENIVFIGVGFGATTAVQYLTSQQSRIKALIGIGMQNHEFLKPKFNLVDNLSDIKQPVLDLYAGRGSSGVLESIDDRRLAGYNKENKMYKQVAIIDAEQYFPGYEAMLVNEIVNWLDETINTY